MLFLRIKTSLVAGPTFSVVTAYEEEQYDRSYAMLMSSPVRAFNHNRQLYI